MALRFRLIAPFRLFSFSETFVVDPTGEIGENIIIGELHALRRKRPALFCCASAP
jgi:hypothetical protein